MADECEQGEFLRDAGEGDLAGLGELPSDHGDGRRPVACEAAVVVLLVPGRQVAADRGVGVALTWFTVGDRGEAFVQVGDRRVAERRAVRRGEYIRERGRERWRLPDLFRRWPSELRRRVLLAGIGVGRTFDDRCPPLRRCRSPPTMEFEG